MIAYTPFLSGSAGQALVIFGFGVVGIYGLAGALQGCMEHRFGWVMRLLAGAGGIACLWPDPLWLNIAGALVVLAVLVYNIRSGPTVRRAAV
mgnify:FL=1